MEGKQGFEGIVCIGICNLTFVSSFCILLLFATTLVKMIKDKSHEALETQEARAKQVLMKKNIRQCLLLWRRSVGLKKGSG